MSQPSSKLAKMINNTKFGQLKLIQFVAVKSISDNIFDFLDNKRFKDEQIDLVNNNDEDKTGFSDCLNDNIKQYGNNSIAQNLDTSIDDQIIKDEPVSNQDNDDKELPYWQQTPKHTVTEDDDWFIVGASILGNMHKRKNIVCQDRYYIKNAKSFGVAVICDGAGSKQHSDLGAQAVSQFVGDYLYNKVVHSSIDEIATQEEVQILKNEVFEQTYGELVALSKFKGVPFESLGSTLIAVIYTNTKSICMHIGDGRGAYQDTGGNWHSFFTPWNTDEGYTIFTTTQDVKKTLFPRDEYLKAIVVDEPISAFAIMSDGCEKASFECLVFDETTQKYYKRNTPYAGFFNPVKKTLVKLHDDNSTDAPCVDDVWISFLTDGMPAFVKEDDDKTMVFAINKYYKNT